MTKRRNRTIGHQTIRNDGPLTDILQSKAWKGLSGAYQTVKADRIKKKIILTTLDTALSSDWWVEGERAAKDGEAHASSPSHSMLDDMNFPAVMRDAVLFASSSYTGKAYILACGDGVIDGFRALRHGEIAPSKVIDDPLSANHGKPVEYSIGQIFVPADRVIVVTTTQSMDDIHCAVEYYKDCLGAIQEGVLRSQLALYKSKGLSNTLQSQNGIEAVKARLGAIDKFRGIMNTIAIDAEEDFTITQAGVGPVIQSYYDVACKNLCMASGIPADILFGDNRNGFASGQSSNERWIDMVSRFQREVLAPIIEAALDILGRGGKVTFESLQTESNGERSIRLERTSIALERMVSLGIMDTEDARRHLIREELVDVIDGPSDSAPEVLK